MFAQRLKELRKRNKITQEQLASVIGVERSSIGKYESTRTIPSADVLVRIARFFDVTIDFLLGNEQETSPIVQKKPDTWIPVLGEVRAGAPMYAEENILDYEEISEKWVRAGEHFGLRVCGDSMEPEIRAGDVVIIRKQPTADTGDIVVAMINGEDATIKRLKRRTDGIVLIPFNSSYDPMFFSNKEITELPVSILGKVVENRRKY